MIILFCNSNAGKKIFSFVGQIFDIIMIAVPIILIIIGSIDFIKALVAQKPDEMKKAQNTFIKRIIIGAVVFFVPAIVSFLMGLIGQNTNSPCMTCFSTPENCKIIENNTSPILVEPLKLNTSECKNSVDKNLCCKEKNGPNDANSIWIWNDNFGCQNTTLNTD